MHELAIGIKNEIKQVVTEDKLAVNVGSGSVRVFATPMMIAGMESAAASLVQPYLEEGKTTVGMDLNVSHIAATPLWMEVRFESELTEIAPNGKIFTFHVTAYDAAGMIGEGTHKRCVVDQEKFEQKAQIKNK